MPTTNQTARILAADQRTSAPRYTYIKFDKGLWQVLDCKTGFQIVKTSDKDSARRVAKTMNRRHSTGHDTPKGGEA